jgi:RNA polymerase sigma factor (sigma-70 family)
MSSKDIEPGARWRNDIAQELSETRFGIICLTAENQTAPWILFEAGALAKTIEELTHVVPYLIGLAPSDIEKGSPLTEFQAKRANEQGTREIVGTINRALGENKLPDLQVEKTFEKWWPDLENELNQLPEPNRHQPPKRPTSDIVEEILELVRQLARSSSNIRSFEELRLSDIFGNIPRSNHSPVEDQRLKAAIHEMLDTLSPRHQMILKMRYGLGDEVPHDYDEIATIFGVSPKRARALEVEALRALKHPNASSHTP